MNITTNSTLSSFNTTLNLTLSKPSFNLLTFFFNNIYLLLLVIIGGIGNGFVIIVFGQRALRSTIGSVNSNMSVYPFLFYMAISDTLYLFIIFCLWLSNYVNILHRTGICQLTLYLTYVCNFINAYYTVSFTAQRLFAVVKPIRVSYVLSWHRSRCLALFIILIACVIYSYLPFLVGIVDGRCYSKKNLRRINEIMDIIDCIIVFLIPYFMIITMNTIILISLKRVKKTEHIFLFQHNLQINKIREITRRNASRKMTTLLLTVSTSYLIICGPYACIHTLRLLNQNKKFQTKFFRQLEYYFHLIYHISFAMNFYIYIAFGSKFRRELKRLLTKCKINLYHGIRRQKSNSYSMDESSITLNSSSNYEQFKLIHQQTPCSALSTTALTTTRVKYKPSTSSYT